MLGIKVLKNDICQTAENPNCGVMSALIIRGPLMFDPGGGMVVQPTSIPW